MKKNKYNYKYIYVDSKYAVNFLKDKVNIKKYKLISFNPSLVLDKSLNVIGLENKEKPEDFIKLGKITYKYSGEIYKKIYKFNNDKILGIWLARYLVSIQNIMYRVNKTKEFIKNDKCLFIKLNLKDARKNNAINGNYYSYMKQYKNCEILEIDYLEKNLNNIGRDPHTTFWIRLNFESTISILFRLICIFCKPFYKIWPYKKIYYSNENTLLKRAVFKFFLKGYSIKHFPKNKNLEVNKINVNKNTLKIFDNIKNTIVAYQREILGNSLRKETSNFFNNDIKKHISDYLLALKVWKEEFSRGALKNIEACFFGYPSTVMELSFSSLAKKKI